MAKISIIVPVYQVEKYLRQCIDSVLAQTFRDFELILVDDGSKDRSGAICDEYAGKDDRICVVHSENAGPGAARNRGIGMASGEYILFLDSDDMLDGAEAISTLLDCAQTFQADIAVGNYRHFSGKKMEGVSRHGLSSDMDSRSVAFRYQGFYLTGHLAYNWGKLYRRGFLLENRLSFQHYRLAEDKLFNICCYACLPRYAFTEESVFLYRRTENSLTKQFDERFAENWISLADAFNRFLQEKNCRENYYDLTAFHVFYGSFFIVEKGYRRGDAFASIVGRLREYGKLDAVKMAMGQLARGKYIFQIPLFSRRVITWGASAVFSLRGYVLFAAATALFVKAQEKNAFHFLTGAV